MSEEKPQPTFSLYTKVKIEHGFYKSFKGKIIEFRITKKNEIEYEVHLTLKDNKTKKDWFNESMLSKTWF